MNKQTDKSLKGHTGIYKRFKLDDQSGKWKDTGKYRAIRRVILDGVSKKEHAVFDNLEDAKTFRAGRSEKVSEGLNVHRNNTVARRNPNTARKCSAGLLLRISLKSE